MSKEGGGERERRREGGREEGREGEREGGGSRETTTNISGESLPGGPPSRLFSMFAYQNISMCMGVEDYGMLFYILLKSKIYNCIR